MAMTLAQLKGMVTIEGVSRALDNQIYNSLTSNSENNADVACNRAAIWAYSHINLKSKANELLTPDQKEIITEAMITMAIYELLRISEFLDEEYKTDAINLMNAALGIAGSSSEGNGSSFIGAASAHDEKSHINKFGSASSRRYHR
ncbi:hypothetical protein [Enterovibrio nigricans]|uniref:Uncharacterized protein n=1 Tax=Enterovibrio nigricans DSM 22720 TaxID=1121868 RepID=A0A1T4UVE4_9GAMM|nr:hypothetical protein [Enterovibrio nigricans]SKA56662.1 hypothetical protein SAMN02745132_02612 [Enterovibrio nigricans DSM 22720]